MFDMEGKVDMPAITFIQFDGTTQIVAADVGMSAMQAAVNHQVPNILADCGGCCACGTCHAYVDDGFIDLIPTADEAEIGMLDAATDVRANSRLTCQIKVTAALDGLTLRVPESQV